MNEIFKTFLEIIKLLIDTMIKIFPVVKEFSFNNLIKSIPGALIIIIVVYITLKIIIKRFKSTTAPALSKNTKCGGCFILFRLRRFSRAYPKSCFIHLQIHYQRKRKSSANSYKLSLSRSSVQLVIPNDTKRMSIQHLSQITKPQQFVFLLTPLNIQIRTNCYNFVIYGVLSCHYFCIKRN